MFEDAEEFTFAEKIDLSRKVMPVRKLWLLPDEGKKNSTWPAQDNCMSLPQIEVVEFQQLP